MILYPAIDIRDGRTVRLVQGDYERETAYDDDPVGAARRWARDGARWLHVVDLDGARAGEPRNLEHVRRIVAAVDIPIQFGGGLRDSGKVDEARGRIHAIGGNVKDSVTMSLYPVDSRGRLVPFAGKTWFMVVEKRV